jgi:hypothetical protein
MAAGTVIESGVLPDGTPYKIWKLNRGTKKIAFIGRDFVTRRSVNWIRKALRGKAGEKP